MGLKTCPKINAHPIRVLARRPWNPLWGLRQCAPDGQEENGECTAASSGNHRGTLDPSAYHSPSRGVEMNIKTNALSTARHDTTAIKAEKPTASFHNPAA